jgi:hypothetical protein
VPKPRPPVAAGKTRICVSGLTTCPPAAHAALLANLIHEAHPNDVETWYYFGTSDEFHGFTKTTFDAVPFPDHLKGHGSSPFCWLETADPADPSKNVITPIGGNDYLSEWARKTYPKDAKVQAQAAPLGIWREVCGPWNNARADAPKATVAAK